MSKSENDCFSLQNLQVEEMDLSLAGLTDAIKGSRCDLTYNSFIKGNKRE